LKYPVIRHYKGAEKNLNDDWYYFARKSKYFQKRSNNYSNIFKFSYLLNFAKLSSSEKRL